MTENTERDQIADLLMSDAVLGKPGWGRGFALVEADAVLAWMRENGYEKREEGSCWDERPAVTRHGECPGMPDLCELPAGHRGAHRSGRVEWLTRKREPVVVDDSARVVDELLIEIDDLADSMIDDHVTMGDIHDALTMLAIRIRNGLVP